MKTLLIILSLILIFNQKIVFSRDSGLEKNFMTEKNFNLWLLDFKVEARKQGISDDLLEEAFLGVKPIKRIVELDKKQPEFTLTLEKYLHNVVSKKRIIKGRNLLSNNLKLLKKIEEKFNVPGNLIISLWGIETNFGEHSGTFSVISALTTLAFDGRRSIFFRKQLIDALKILNEGHVELSQMKGSWAGAMGQCQFMPSTFLQYAIDYNNDGKKDLWESKEDALASAANYLSKMGWNPKLTWGREVLAPNNFIAEKKYSIIEQTIKEWSIKGFRNLDKTVISESDIKAKLLILDSKSRGKRFFLIYKNFDVILKWNKSNFFAVAVGKLSDQITYVK